MTYYILSFFKTLLVVAFVLVIIDHVPGGHFLGEIIFGLKRLILALNWTPFWSIVKDLIILGLYIALDFFTGRDS